MNLICRYCKRYMKRFATVTNEAGKEIDLYICSCGNCDSHRHNPYENKTPLWVINAAKSKELNDDS